MNSTKITIEQIDSFLKGTETLEIATGVTIEDKYEWLKTILIQTRYQLLRSRKEKSLVRKFLVRCSGYSKSHIDHLISDFKTSGTLKRKPRDCATEFQTFYTKEDIVLLAETSEAYFHQNGKAIKEVLRDMYHVYGDNRFERLAHLSVSRLYDLRKTSTYQNTVLTYQKTKPTAVNIGERKKPHPEGKPGYLRVDSVHQGDKDKEKGVYHIHLVDEVTQWDVQLATEGINEYFLLPILEEAISLFPFLILNFHSDNGSEYINKLVAGLLERLRIKQTKSRSRRTNDNALIEGKHAATTRPVFGKVHIPKQYAKDINVFNREHLIPFLNYHRKCAFGTEVVGKQGKITKVYKEYVTPVEKLLSLSDVEVHLNDSVRVADLRQTMVAMSHLEVAQQMQKARTKLFKNFKK